MWTSSGGGSWCLHPHPRSRQLQYHSLGVLRIWAVDVAKLLRMGHVVVAVGEVASHGFYSCHLVPSTRHLRDWFASTRITFKLTFSAHWIWVNFIFLREKMKVGHTVCTYFAWSNLGEYSWFDLGRIISPSPSASLISRNWRESFNDNVGLNSRPLQVLMSKRPLPEMPWEDFPAILKKKIQV